MITRVRYSLAAGAAILWIASFFLHIAWTNDGWLTGWQVAAAGWAGPLAGQFGWYANAIMIPALGMLALGEPRGDFGAMSKLSVVLFLLWSNTLFWTDLRFEGGTQVILTRGAGYYAWMASLLIVWMGLFVFSRQGWARRWAEDFGVGHADAPEDEERQD